MGRFGRERAGACEPANEVGVCSEEGDLEVFVGLLDNGAEAIEEGGRRVERAERPRALGDPGRMLEDWPEDCCEFGLSEGVYLLQVHVEGAVGN